MAASWAGRRCAPALRPAAPRSSRAPDARAAGQGAGGGTEGPRRRAPRDGGRRTCRRAGSPAPGVGYPEARASLQRGAGPPGCGGDSAAGAPRTAAGRSHRWAAARGRGGAEPGPRTPAIRPGAPRAGTLPRPRRSRPFSPLQLSWLLPHLGPRAQVTSLPRSFFGRGGARVSPTSLRLAGAGEGRPVRGWRSGAGRRLRALLRPRGPLRIWGSGPCRRERAAAPAETWRLSVRSPEGDLLLAPRCGWGPLGPSYPAPAGARSHPRPGSPRRRGWLSLW